MTGVAHQGLGDPSISSAEMAGLAGTGDPGVVAGRMDQLRQAQARVHVARPGRELDLTDAENYIRQDFFRAVGRPPGAAEIMGIPRDGCAACERMSGMPCDAHVRKAGTEIAYPPHPWPSEQPGHYPGTARIASGPDKPPYNVLRSVQ